MRFATSAFSNVVTEVVEAVLIARDASTSIASAWTGLSHRIARFGSKSAGYRVQSVGSGRASLSAAPDVDWLAMSPASNARVVPVEPPHSATAAVPSAQNDGAQGALPETPLSAHSAHSLPESLQAPHSPTALASSASGNPASQRKVRVELIKTELADRLAHDDFGEKCALVLACSVGVLLRGSCRDAWLNAITLAILEAVSDEVKYYIYASRGIFVHARANLKHGWVTWLGASLVGAGSCSLLLAGIRLNCLVEDAIAG